MVLYSLCYLARRLPVVMAGSRFCVGSWTLVIVRVILLRCYPACSGIASRTASLTARHTASRTTRLTASLTTRLTTRLTASRTTRLTASLTTRLTASRTTRLTASLTTRLTASLTASRTALTLAEYFQRIFGIFLVWYFLDMARWQSGYAKDCKSFYVGSIPARASFCVD